MFLYEPSVVFQLSDLLIKVWVEAVGLDSRAVSFHLLFIEIYKDSGNVFKKLVDPAEVEKRLVDGLYKLRVSSPESCACACDKRTTKIKSNSFTLFHFSVYFSFLKAGETPPVAVF